MKRDSYWFVTLVLITLFLFGGFVFLYREKEPSSFEYLKIQTDSKEITVGEINPIKGSVKGGENVVIKGSNFPLKTEVFFGDKLASEVKVEEDGKSLVATTPEASESGMVSVFVTGYGVDLIEAPVKFFYIKE